MITVEEFIIKHHGVKGMKWGVRKKRKAGFEQFSDDAKRAIEIRKKEKNARTVRVLSNQEIKDFTERVRLETAFRTATPTPRKKVLNMIKSILGDGKTINEAATFADSPIGKEIRSGLKKGNTARKERRAGPLTS